MELRELKQLLQQPYKTDNWRQLLNHVFDNVQFLSDPNIIPTGDERVHQLKQYGSVRLEDRKNLALFELTLNDNVNLIRNRVGLNELVKRYIDQDTYHGILSIFEQGREDYRFTFTAKNTEFDEDQGFIDKDTDTKRFTYILGANESCRTAAERFDLLSRNSEKDIKAVEEAFNVEKLSKSFFNEYIAHFNSLVGYLKSEPSYYQGLFEKEETQARNYVKRFMGRLVFLKFIQKKGWLGVPVSEPGWNNGDYNFLENQYQNFPTKDLFVSQFLNPLFYEGLNRGNRLNFEFQNFGYKIPYLSGGLFENENTKDNRIDFPEPYLTSLFDFFGQYNFTIDENDLNDKEVGIDPEMLGHIFENLLEDNKDKGAFYTPKDIVRYMCQESLKEYLKTYLQQKNIWPEDKTRQEDLENKLSRFVEKKETAAILKFDKELATALRDVKICDPAIGSGAFPMGLLQEIFKMIKNLHEESPDRVGEVWGMMGKNWEPTTVKQNIIQNSIYGVDLEPGAVDIARLRFWLSLVIEEEEPKPLPHLDYKIVVGDSLVSKLEDTIIQIDWKVTEDNAQTQMFGNPNVERRKEILNEITKKQKQIFDPNSDDESLGLEIRNLKIDLLINQLELMIKTQGLEEKPTQTGRNFKKQTELWLQTMGWKSQIKRLQKMKEGDKTPLEFFDWKLDFPEVMNPEVNQKFGFDIVIGNPPYLSNKGVGDSLKEYYGFSDDLYNYFFLKGNDILKRSGIFCYITSSTFLTLQTKSNIRELILGNQLIDLVNLGHDVFESAMVSTAITIYKKEPYNDNIISSIIDARGKTKLKKANSYRIKVSEFRNTPNKVLFTPNEFNISIHKTYSHKLKELLTNYWEMISTSRNITKFSSQLSAYQNQLKPGDITLLGLVTDGGQGLATGNNGRFVGVLNGTSLADRVLETRISKLRDFNNKNQTNFNINGYSENEIRGLFDQLKIEYGRDSFGQGYLFRIVNESEIADVENLSEEEKIHGIASSKCFVPYDKGDRDGNRWYLKTPYYIDWSVDAVRDIKSRSHKSGKGKALWQNSQFYFKEGFCWSDIHTVLIKSRLKGVSVHDVKSMSLFPLSSKLSAKYLVCILNSHFASEFSHEFLNNTSSFQINDARRFPIIVPTQSQLEDFESIFDRSYQIQLQKFDKLITEGDAERQLEVIQEELDAKVNELYKLN